jgi:chemotaxis protein CheD
MNNIKKSSLFRHRKNPDGIHHEKKEGKYFDSRVGMDAVMVLPGRHYVTSNPKEMIVTLLGSCVAACIRDPIAKVGGLNHFLLPESETGHWGQQVDAAMRYGNHAMETLINDIIKLGGVRSRLEVKVFGGAHVIEGASVLSVGQKNVDFVQSYLANEGFLIAASHLGGHLPRRIHYFPLIGKVQMRQLERSSDKELFNKEMRFRKEINLNDEVGDAELFG